MFFSKPKLPVTEDERAWVDESLDEMTRLFGDGISAKPIVLPNIDFFPRDHEPTEDWGAFVFEQVCDLMGVSRNRISLKFIDEIDVSKELAKSLPSSRYGSPDTDGVWIAPKADGATPTTTSLMDVYIQVKIELIHDPVALIATITRDLARVIMLSDELISPNREDVAPIADLYAIFSGFGIFAANSAFNFRQWSGGGKKGWSVQRRGHLSEPVYGYALARYAQIRKESKPAWSKLLCLNVKTFMLQSAKVLRHEADHSRKYR